MADPYTIRLYTRPDHTVLYAESRRELFVSADRWEMEVDELCAFIDYMGDGYTYTSPAGFAYSLFTKLCPVEGFTLSGEHDNRFQMARAAVYGARCEVYYYSEQPAPLHQYDINGAYSDAAINLSFPVPTTLHYTREPSLANILQSEGMSEITFSQEGWIPILPVHYGGRMIFPHADHVIGTYSHNEIRYALHHAPEITLHKIHAQYIADTTYTVNPFWPFVQYCWDRRSIHPVWKMIANALYGRLAIAGNGLWCFRPQVDYSPQAFSAVPRHLRGYFGGCCVGELSHAPARANPLWAAMILAFGRSRLHSLITPETVYVDTDCLFCTQPQLLPVAPDLGMFKYRYGDYHIRGTKAYRAVDSEGKSFIKLRGISRQWRNEQDFQRARVTEERDLLPDGRTQPYVVKFT
jgi:hypothetical protein